MMTSVPFTQNRRSISYRSLDAKRIIESVVALRGRIQDAFPRAGLCRIAGEVEIVALESAERAAYCAEPQWHIRAIAVLLTIAGITGVVLFVTNVHVNFSAMTASQILQDTYNIMNDMILFSIGILFLWNWEGRIKRSRALKALHELRSLAHIVDMHQLTKDPESLAKVKNEDPAQAKGPINRMELVRYLVFCTDLLGTLGKISALYAQEFQDGTVLNAVTEIEGLSTSLSQKIWQKITIVERSEARA
jgi:hypothetical protein